MVELWEDNGSGPVQNPELTQEEFDAGLVELQGQNVQALWQAATDYQEAQISGAAYGLVTMGVLQQKPKALSVMAWINSVWALYYTRKSQVTHQWNAALLDFSSCGSMPASVPDLMTELGM